MGSMYVDGSPSWESIGTGMANEVMGAPQKALANMSTADQIAWNRKMKGEQMKSQAAYQAAVDELYKNATPLTMPGPPQVFQGPVLPEDPSTALPPPIQTTVPDVVGNAQRERDYQLARTAGGATVLHDPSTWAQQRGYAGVASRGPATNPYDRVQDTVFLTGKYPTAAEGNGAHNYTIHNDSGPTGRSVMSFDGKTIAGTSGQPLTSILGPNERLLVTGPADATPLNPLKDEGSAQQAFYELANKLLTRPKEFTDADLTKAMQYRDRGWGRETKTFDDPTTKAPMERESFKTPLPTEGPAAKLMAAIAGLGTGAVPTPPPPAPTPPSPFDTGAAPVISAAPTDPAIDALAVPVPPGAATAATAPPPPAPIVPAPAAVAGGPRRIAPGDANIILKEYTDHPLVRSLDQARSGYSSMLSAMPKDDAISDLAIFIGAAKVLDPPSVVRDQEGQRIAGGASPMDQFFGKLNRLQGGSGLTRETRLQIWAMVNDKLQQDINNVSAIREQKAVQLRNAGHGDPDKWLDKLPQVAPLDRRIVNSKKLNADAPEGEDLYYPSENRYGVTPPPPPPAAVRPGDRWR